MKHACKCKHEWQDKTHGNGVRVFNPTSKKYPDGQQEYRCTVCGSLVKTKQGQ